MPAYIVRYTNDKGRVRQETMFAPDMTYLQGALQRKNYWPLSIKVEERKSRTYKKKLGAQDLISILDQIEIQLDVNINIDDAFRNLVDEFPRGKARFVVATISDEINSSGRVADACGQFPRIFPDHVRQMISVGESTGKLAQSFRRLIEYYQNADALKSVIISASMYPSMVVFAMVCFIFIVFGFTMPTMVKVFNDMGTELPPLTKFLVGISDFFVDHLLLMGLLTLALPFVGMFVFRSKVARPFIDYLIAKAAVIGPITRDVCIARFATNLGALYESEIPIVQGLAICSKVAGNYLYNRGLAVVRAAVEEGRSISEGLREAKVFPTMVILTIRIGEENGKLDQSLKKLSDYHGRKAKERVERALKLFEPVMLIVIVVMVGVLAFAMLSPMMQMIQQMSESKK